jgi:cytochrome c553
LAKGKVLVETGGDGETLQCATCHGFGLRGVGDAPRIAGLSPIYIARQLANFQSGQNAGGASGSMTPIISGLNDDEILAIAAYVASLTP